MAFTVVPQDAFQAALHVEVAITHAGNVPEAIL
jgi:hypothetical protein